MKNSNKNQVIFLKGDGESVPTDIIMGFFPQDNITAVTLKEKLLFIEEKEQDPRMHFPEANRSEFREMLSTIIAAGKTNLAVLNRN